MFGGLPRCLRLPLARNHAPRSGLSRPFSSNRWDDDRNTGPSEEEHETARQWLARLHSNTIPRSVGKVSYSTSSGPGGQHVNRTNTKATLTIPLDDLLPRVPKVLHPTVRSSHLFAKGSNSLIITSQDSRNRTANLNRCYDKLQDILASAGDNVVPGRTSPEQRERVKRLQAAEKEGRMKMKKAKSQKKQNRRSKGWDD